MDQNIIVIDQGSHSSRALVFDAAGTVLASASAPVSTSFPQNTFVEQSPDEILQSILSALAQLQNRLDIKQLASIKAAALIVQRSSMLACRKDNLQAITQVISWQDTRNQLLLHALQPQHPAIKAITGLRPNAHYGASKMRWLLDNNNAVQREYADGNLLFVPLAAWLASQLTGAAECRVDPVIASRTLLTGLGEMHWHGKLLQLFGVSPSCLPRIAPSLHNFGDIKLGGNAIPLELVGGDQSFIAFAFGLPVQADTAYVNVGTGAFVQMLKPEPCTITELLNSPLAISARAKVIVLEGTVNAAATALDWLWQNSGEQLDFAGIEQALSSVKHPPLFINTIAGTGSPYWLPASAPQFVGGGTVPEKTVAVMESIVFALVDNIRYMQQANPALKAIMIGGGLSQSDGFCQKLASLSGLTVTRPVIHEISARGAAFYLMQKQRNSIEDTQHEFSIMTDETLKNRYEEHVAIMKRLADACCR